MYTQSLSLSGRHSPHREAFPAGLDFRPPSPVPPAHENRYSMLGLGLPSPPVRPSQNEHPPCHLLQPRSSCCFDPAGGLGDMYVCTSSTHAGRDLAEPVPSQPAGAVQDPWIGHIFVNFQLCIYSPHIPSFGVSKRLIPFSWVHHQSTDRTKASCLHASHSFSTPQHRVLLSLIVLCLYNLPFPP